MAESAFRREITRMLASVQYFTRIPVPAWVTHEPARLDDTARYFPAVGLLVGLVGAGTLLATAQLWPLPVAVVLSVIATVLTTGAFHEDGLADAFDGLAGSRDRAEALAIMKDSRIGVFGATALVLILLLKVVTLSAMPVRAAALALIAGHIASRVGVVLIMATSPYVRETADSRSQPFVERISGVSLLVASATGALALALLGLRGVIVGLAVVLVCALWSRYLLRRLGGYTGDCLGAAQQLGESALYLVCAATWQASV
jgi:adenosylcobinamide-GDP ribazoletransferase